MSFILKKTRFLWHIKETVITSLPLMPKRDDGKDQMERIYRYDEKIDESQDNVYKTIAKIRKIYAETV